MQRDDCINLKPPPRRHIKAVPDQRSQTRTRYLQGGLEHALGELPRPGQKPKFDAVQAATIIATACSSAPDGRDHWTLRMLGSRAVELGFVDSCSPETIRQLLKKASSSPGKNKSGASPR